MTCAICGKEGEGFQVIKLSAKERGNIPGVKEEYAFCPPCHAIISDKWHGLNLIMGLYQAELRKLGVVNPEPYLKKLRMALLGGKA